MLRKPLRGEHRSAAQIREHYEIEKELATRLRAAPKSDRRHLYSSLYDELYRRVPHHQQLTAKFSPETVRSQVARQLGLLRKFLNKSMIFLEVGPGDCALAIAVAPLVKRVYAVDVSAVIIGRATVPENLQLLLTDGCSIDVPNATVDVAYSNQLMEHLHPEDAIEQLKNIHVALRPGGLYVSITPNRLSGPWDISMYFDSLATGFHLKEYTVTELNDLFRSVGFSRTRAYVGARGLYVRFPVSLIQAVEKGLTLLPERLRNLVAHSAPFRILLGMRLVATK
jgi:SAM-dependent methyltransferase